MAAYALVRLADSAVLDQREFAETPPDVSRKGIAWRPVIVTDPAFDPAGQVKSAPITTVEKDRVSVVSTVRAKTADEIDAEKGSTVDAMDVLQLKVAFNHENRIRALEGKQPVSAAQFKTALKALL